MTTLNSKNRLFALLERHILKNITIQQELRFLLSNNDGFINDLEHGCNHQRQANWKS